MGISSLYVSGIHEFPIYTLLFKVRVVISLSFFGVQLIYNVVLVSGVQQNESVTHIHKFTPFFPRFFLHVGCYKALNRVPCALQ